MGAILISHYAVHACIVVSMDLEISDLDMLYIIIIIISIMQLVRLSPTFAIIIDYPAQREECYYQKGFL